MTLAESAPGAVNALRPPELSGPGELRLLVEDEATVRKVLRTVLAKAGYRIIECASGAAALKERPQGQPEVA